ncbi:MAG: TIGR03936 family radical SAM-associated protein [Lachnospiraceae bacterium]|nr:TIGR03936 family radical SAM-associated protein [Lachnospiraceae bacterium]
MKLRIKYTKTGVLRFIGHLDIMRLFQKAIRRAKLDVAYSKGFSPHQIISFAAPMPLGMTSEGEYFDGDFVSVTSTEDMMNRLNDTMPEGVKVLDIVELEEGAKPSMSVVSASDYYIYKNDECTNDYLQQLIDSLADFMTQEKIEIMKKTKSKEEMSDIKPGIYKLENKDDGIYMLLASGSVLNLKPELVIEALCKYSGLVYNRYDYMVHRLETYMGERNNLQSLITAGKRF